MSLVVPVEPLIEKLIALTPSLTAWSMAAIESAVEHEFLLAVPETYVKQTL